MDALTLLSGDAQTFLEKVWASHIHVHHTEPDPLVALLALDDVDELLTASALRTPALRLAKNGTVLPASRFTRSASLAGSPLTGLVDPRKVLDLFESGASVVLQGLHRYWPPLADLVRELELALGHPCQANAYLTPPDSQGFALHSDTHDVFVFQTHGVKQWEVHDEGGARDVVLEPGVSMYLPTGTPHAARTTHSASLHVTIGINRVTWRQILQAVTADILRDQRYDAAVPAGYLDDPTGFADLLGDELHRLAGRVGESDSRQVVGHQTVRFLSSRNPTLRGGFTDRLRLDEITDETLLTRRPGAPCVLVEEGESLRVLLGDRQLVVPARLLEPFALVRERTSLRPADLRHWLDRDSRLVLARRLVREGLLRTDG